VTSSLAGGWSDEDDEMDCQGDVCFEKYQYLKTAKNNVAGGLKYQEKLSARAESRDLVSVCLPAVNEKFVAFMFNSCSEKKGAGAEVCLVQKRGWLKSNGKHLVPNKEDLLSNLAALPGGDEAVRTCLELGPEYQYEQYEIYDYADYGAEWDYLEESGSRAVRKRREAAKETGGKENNSKQVKDKKKKKIKNPKKGGRKGTRKGKKSGKGQKKKKGVRKQTKTGKGDNKKAKKSKKQNKKKPGKGRKGQKSGKGGKRKGDKEKKDKKKDKKDKKAKKAADRKAAKDKKSDKAEKSEKQSGVSKATMSQLSCVEDRIAELLAACGEKILGSREV